MRERMKTVSVALVICLNVGVDPPDVTKTQPCARVECWIDPAALNPARQVWLSHFKHIRFHNIYHQLIKKISTLKHFK